MSAARRAPHGSRSASRRARRRSQPHATNVALHAYVEAQQPGDFCLSIEAGEEIDDRFLRVTVADDGSGMKPRIDSPGSGMGLPIIARVTDLYEVRTPATGGTELSMSFKLPRTRKPV